MDGRLLALFLLTLLITVTAIGVLLGAAAKQDMPRCAAVIMENCRD